MSTIITRAGKGSPLTNNEVDANFTNLNSDKLQSAITVPVAIDVNSTTNALRITQTGAGNALLVEDSANPDATPFVVDASGNVIVGTISPSVTTYPLYVEGNGAFASTGSNVAATSPTIGIGRRRTGGASVGSGDSIGKFSNFGWDGTNFIEASRIEAAVDGTPGTNDMPGRLVFSTTADGASSPTERMRIDNAGRVGIGGTPGAQNRVRLVGSSTGNLTQYGFLNELTTASDVTGTSIGFTTSLSTAAAAFTLSDLRHFSASFTTIGAGSTVTTQYGFYASAALIGATNNYGFYSNIASGTGRWNFYAAGTAANVFAGTTSIGGLVGSESLRVTPVASAVNYLSAFGAVTTGTPVLSSQGSDTNISLILRAKGTGGVNLESNGQVIFASSNASGSDFTNYFTTTGQLSYAAAGSSTNINFKFTAKAAGNLNFSTGGGTQFLVSHTASAVNYLQATGGATGAAATMSAQGSDTNIDIALTPKGTGVLKFGTYTAGILAQAGYITIKDAAGNTRRLLVG